MRHPAVVLQVRDRAEQSDDDIEIRRGAGEKPAAMRRGSEFGGASLGRGGAREERAREGVGQSIHRRGLSPIRDRLVCLADQLLSPFAARACWAEADSTLVALKVVGQRAEGGRLALTARTGSRSVPAARGSRRSPAARHALIGRQRRAALHLLDDAGRTRAARAARSARAAGSGRRVLVGLDVVAVLHFVQPVRARARRRRVVGPRGRDACAWPRPLRLARVGARVVVDRQQRVHGARDRDQRPLDLARRREGGELRAHVGDRIAALT